MEPTERPAEDLDCAAVREDLPQLALGALGPDEAVPVERHVERCPACRAALEAQREVLEAVRRETGPDRPLDVPRVLERLRRSLAHEPPRLPPPPPGPPWGRVAFVFALLAVLVAGVITLLRHADDEKPPALPAEEVATLYLGDRTAGRPVRARETCAGGRGGAALQFARRTEVRLDAGAELTATTAAEGHLSIGRAAFAVSDAPFAVWTVGVRVSGEKGARFSVAVDADGAIEVAVAEGKVRCGERTIEAGQAGRWPRGALDPVVQAIDPQAAFAWVLGPAVKDLMLELRAPPPVAGRAWVGTVVLANRGERPVSVTAHHPLGANYQFELRTASRPAPAHQKVPALALRRRLKAGPVEPLQESWGEVELQPGDAYELDVDLRALAPGREAVNVVTQYLSFRARGAAGEARGTWGFALRSPETALQPK